jgi:hypothetical protein
MSARRPGVPLLATLVVLNLIASAASSTPAFGQSSPQIPPTFFGMTTNYKNNWPSVPFGALGKGTLVSWSYSEPERGQFNWSNLDAWLAAAEAHGLDFFYSSDRVPPWAAIDKGACAPTYRGSNVIGCTSDVADIADWDSFVLALARRYKKRLIYELWNEPQYSKIPPERMALLAKHAFNDIRSVAPEGLILAPSGSAAYMDKYYAAGGPTDVDVVSFHSYRSNPEGVLEDVAQMRAVMARHGLSSKPLWDTEGGWGTASLSEDQQAAFLARYYLLQWSAKVSRFYWYAWDDPEWGTLWDAKAGPHPAALAYQQIHRWLVGATMSAPCESAPNGTWTCTLKRTGGYQALAIWNSTTTTTYAPSKQYNQYQDLAGNVMPVNGPINIGANPILLEKFAAAAEPHNSQAH